MLRRKLFAALGLCSAALALPLATLAQSGAAYPAKPVRILVGVAPGGATDVFARIAAQKFGEAFGQTFIVENRAGAGGTLAADAAAKAAADGYTLLVSAPSVMVVAPHLYKQLNFVPSRDFTPVAFLGGGPLFLGVQADLPVRSVADLIALAKSKPGQLAFGSGGNGTASHLSAEMFASMAGIKLIHSPYKGDGQAVTDLGGGQVQMVFTSYNLLEPLIRGGRIRAMAVTSRDRLANFPQLPSLQESGLRGYESLGWIGLYGPAGLPATVVQRLNSEWVKARDQADLTARLTGMGLNAIVINSAEDFAAFQRAENTRWSKVIADAGVKPE